MTRRDRFVSTIGGRPALFALGILYIVGAIGLAYVEVSEAQTMREILIISFFIAGPGAILITGASWLPQTTINPCFYPTVTRWCYTAILVLGGLLTIYHLQPGVSIDNFARAMLVITGFVVVPAFAGGVNDATAKTRRFELEQRNEELHEAHQELEETIARLEAANDELERSNERLEQFAYAASHDLQEPLRMVSSYLQLIERNYGDLLDDDGKEYFAFAVDGADRMRAMVNGLLRYSRVESAGNPFEPVDLNDLLTDVEHDLSVQITEHNATIESEELPRVKGDAEQLHHVFQNLIQNAIQYHGDEPPRVQIMATRTNSTWEIAVEDNGSGIDPAEHQRIFTIFQRHHSRDEVAGAGIGLALCERIIERHNGRIWVESTPGQGSTFSFTLQAIDAPDN